MEEKGAAYESKNKHYLFGRSEEKAQKPANKTKNFFTPCFYHDTIDFSLAFCPGLALYV
jgi:hypothetical protein